MKNNIFGVLRSAAVYAAACFAILFGAVMTVSAATFTVNSTTDTVDSSPGNGVCLDAVFRCTVRAAIMEANAFAGVDTIRVPSGTYTLTILGTGENGSLTGDLDIIESVIVSGAGENSTFIDAGGIDRVLHILSGATVRMNGITAENGNPGANAGGIFNQGTTTLTHVRIVGNTGLDFGGGILNEGDMTIVDSAVHKNITNGGNLSGGGGGIFNQGVVAITHSTISDNTTFGRGGGIYNLDQTVTLTNATVSGNTGLNGGGIFNRFGTVSLNHTTHHNNTATDNGGGIWNFGGVTTLTNSIIAGNSAATPADNCAGGMTSLGYNIAGDGSCALAGTGDLNSTNPLLGLLANNGGPTETHALLAGSPAIDSVALVACVLMNDQRGVPRPQGASCDRGAYERLVVDACNSISFTNIIMGTNGNDILIGTPFSDLIFGLAGNDIINGLSGDDCILGGDGNDTINGSNGNDVLAGEGGNDTINGSNGNDTIEGGIGNDKINASNGDDTVFGGDGDDTIAGSNGNDYLEGNDGDDTITGSNGTDTLVGGLGTDSLNGGSSIDTCDGEIELFCEL